MRLVDITDIKKPIKLYHISFDSKLAKVWEPEDPLGGIKVSQQLAEPSIPRICLSPTIEQCFQAIYPNVSQFFEKKNYPHMDFYVYVPEIEQDTLVVYSKTLTTEKLVHDAHMTKEHWIISPVKMNRYSKIRIYNTNDNKVLNYYPYNDKTKTKVFFAPTNIKIEELKKY
jgi:hypothetical protein